MSSKGKGNRAEEKVLNILRAKGMIGEIIETKMRMIRVGGRAVMVPDSGRKLGDIFGLYQGKAVLVEVKAVDSLAYSILEDHQHESLRKWAQGGGVALVAHVVGDSVTIIDYPLDWCKGENISKYYVSL